MGNKQGTAKRAPQRAAQTNRKQEKEAMKICTLDYNFHSSLGSLSTLFGLLHVFVRKCTDTETF